VPARAETDPAFYGETLLPVSPMRGPLSGQRLPLPENGRAQKDRGCCRGLFEKL